jgi:hypothetical protein
LPAFSRGADAEIAVVSRTALDGDTRRLSLGPDDDFTPIAVGQADLLTSGQIEASTV